MLSTLTSLFLLKVKHALAALEKLSSHPIGLSLILTYYSFIGFLTYFYLKCSGGVILLCSLIKIKPGSV